LQKENPKKNEKTTQKRNINEQHYGATRKSNAKENVKEQRKKKHKNSMREKTSFL
jgi:hypothetical protein